MRTTGTQLSWVSPLRVSRRFYVTLLTPCFSDESPYSDRDRDRDCDCD